MKNKIDNILLGTLWLLAATILTCFWFNTMYGFNIFSGTHWDYLARMQAGQTPVKISFYISMFICVAFSISGLYILIRPRFRKIKLTTTPQTQTPPKTNTIPTETHPTSDIPPTTPVEKDTPATNQSYLQRPARLNIPHNNPGTPSFMQNSGAPVAPVTPVAPSTPTPMASEPKEYPQLNAAFESAGYTIKPNAKISGLQTSLFAIGANETVWIGAVGVQTDTLQSAIDTIQQVFSDTLEDIEITVTGFVIDAVDSAAPNAPQILTFNTIEDATEYISQHPSEPVDEEMQENFDAFSTYISTVIDYIGKI